MIDFGFDKLALIGTVALIVIGPEKLPRVARTVGTLMGKARRYVADVKAEVNRTIELEELQKMKSQFESAASEVEQTVNREFSSAQTAFDNEYKSLADSYGSGDAAAGGHADFGAPLATPPLTSYKAPRKNWRIKRGAVPRWYKQRQGVRGHVQSGAARVARHTPASMKKR